MQDIGVAQHSDAVPSENRRSLNAASGRGTRPGGVLSVSVGAPSALVLHPAQIVISVFSGEFGTAKQGRGSSAAANVSERRGAARSQNYILGLGAQEQHWDRHCKALGDGSAGGGGIAERRDARPEAPPLRHGGGGRPRRCRRHCIVFAPPLKTKETAAGKIQQRP